MTKEEKQLLLKDLSARLLYGVVYHRNDGANIKLNAIDVESGLLNYTDDIDERECKPYLRPMYTMTDDEFSELKNAYWTCPEDATYCIYGNIDWLDKNMFDYRGLIPKGLALEAKEGMYNIENI